MLSDLHIFGREGWRDSHEQYINYIAGPSCHCHWAQTLQLSLVTLVMFLSPPARLNSMHQNPLSLLSPVGVSELAKLRFHMGVSD